MEILQVVSYLEMTSDLLSQGFHGGDVHTATFCVVQQHPQDGKLSTDGLSTASGSSHKHVIITVVHSIEHWGGRDNTGEDSSFPPTLSGLWGGHRQLYLVFEWG